MENRAVGMDLLMFLSIFRKGSQTPQVKAQLFVISDTLMCVYLSVYVKFVFLLGLQSVEKASHLAGWLSARRGDGLQLWH